MTIFLSEAAAARLGLDGATKRRSTRPARDARPDIPRAARAGKGDGDRVKDLDTLARAGWTIYHYQAGVHELRNRDGRAVMAATYRACLDAALEETP